MPVLTCLAQRLYLSHLGARPGCVPRVQALLGLVEGGTGASAPATGQQPGRGVRDPRAGFGFGTRPDLSAATCTSVGQRTGRPVLCRLGDVVAAGLLVEDGCCCCVVLHSLVCGSALPCFLTKS